MFELMAPLMFAGLVVFLLIGYPVAFALGANGLLFGFIGMQLGYVEFTQLQALPERVFGIMSNATLLAIPFFTFMGLILERSGLAEELLDAMGQLFGALRGGLAYSVIFVGALLAATTGVVAATVIAMGLISLPIMLRYGYDKRVACGVIAACMPTTTASWPIYKWQKPPISPMPYICPAFSSKRRISSMSR